MSEMITIEEDIDNEAVRAFSEMMRKKMALSRANGRSGWHDPDRCSPEYLRALLYEHLDKGDPVDVANICMMLRHYQEPTSPNLARAEAAEAKLARAVEGLKEALEAMNDHVHAYPHMDKGYMVDARATATAILKEIANG